MESNGSDNQNHSRDNNQQEYHQHQHRRLNAYPLHAYHQTGFNGHDTMSYLLSGSNEKTQEQARRVHLQANYKNSVTEVGESSNRSIINLQVEESPIGLSLSKSTLVVNQSQLGLTQRSNKPKQKRKKKLIASEDSKFKAIHFDATSIQVGLWMRETKNPEDVVVKFYYGKKKLIWEFLYGALKKKMEIRWSQVSAIKTFDDEHLNGYLLLELSEPPEFSEETNYIVKGHTNWLKDSGDFTGGQASICRRHTVKCPPGVLNKHISDLFRCNSHLYSLSQKPFPRHSPPFHNLNGPVYTSASIHATNNGNHQGEFIHYVPNVVQPSGCFGGTVYPNIPSPAFNQIERRRSYETPGTNGVTPPTLNGATPGTNGVYTPSLNQIATRDMYETHRTNGVYTSALNQFSTSNLYKTPGTNGVYRPALNQIATRDTYETPGTNGVAPPTLNQIATRDLYETPGTNGVYTPALNQIAARDTYETPGTNGVYTSGLNQIATSDLYETPGTNGVCTPALNHITARDTYETPGTNDVYTSALNQIATSDLYETPGTNGVYALALKQIATRDMYETPGYTPALNQIATSDLYETPGTNGVHTPALNQIATTNTYDTPGTNGVYTPALNQIATRELHETPATNGVYTSALNQIATRDMYETPATNGVYTPALNQIATNDLYETPGTNSVYTPALNQTASTDLYETPGTNSVYAPALNQTGTRDLHKTQGTNGVWVQRGNKGNQEISFTPNRDGEDVTDLKTETLPEYTNEQIFLNDDETNKTSDQSYLMNPNTHHQNLEDSSMLPVGAVIPVVDSGIGGSEATNDLECLNEDDIAFLQSLTDNDDDLINCDDAANRNDFEDTFKTSDGNVFPPEP